MGGGNNWSSTSWGSWQTASYTGTVDNTGGGAFSGSGNSVTAGANSSTSRREGNLKLSQPRSGIQENGNSWPSPSNINVPLNQGGRDNSLTVTANFWADGRDYSLQLVANKTLDSSFTGGVIIKGDTGEHPYSLTINTGDTESSITTVPVDIHPIEVITGNYMYHGDYHPIYFNK